MFFSCSLKRDFPVETADNSVIHRTSINLSQEDPQIQTLDAFVFTKNGKLDCYQRFTNPDALCEIASDSGEKQLFLIANSDKDIYEWAEIRSLASAADIYADLENETWEHPLMTSLQTITAGQKVSADLFPLRSEITIRSLRCDFSGKPYHNELLTDIKIYLTYVNASCSIIPEERIMPSRIIGKGLNCMEITEPVGNETAQIGKTLFCYANEPEEESIGSPFTRLVIEGNIGGKTYYYPIKVNSINGGIARGCRYIFDVILTKTGATDPDGELIEEDIEIAMEVMEWKEKDWYDVLF